MFSVLDKNNTGTLKSEDLIKILSITGEDPLTEKEIFELCNACGISSADEVDINDISKLLNSVDELDESDRIELTRAASCTRRACTIALDEYEEFEM